MSALRAKLPVLVGGGVLLLLLAGLVWMIKGFIDHSEAPAKRQVQQISLVKPPPPKVEEKPPEPEKPPEVKQEVPMEQPNPEPAANNEPPPDDAVGSNLGPGNDGFGLGKGNGSGRVIGGGGSRERWYAGLLGTRIEQTLNRDSKLLSELKSKRIVVRIWVNGQGQVEKVDWDKGAVPAESEAVLREQLLSLNVAESPEGINQPIWYRFRPRG